MFLPMLLDISTQLSTAGSVFVEGTVAVVLTMLTVLALSIQVARGYFLKILRKFTLRLAADIWWLLFVILRDTSIFLVVFLGLLLFWPGVYQDFPIAVPFQPFAVDLFAFALVIMLIKDVDEEPFYNSVVTLLVLLGTALYTTGTIFVTESALQLSSLPPTVSDSTSNIWGFFAQFSSINNPALSIYSFYVCYGLLLAAGAVAVLYSFKGGIFDRQIEPKPQPIVKEVFPPQPPSQPQQGSSPIKR